MSFKALLGPSEAQEAGCARRGEIDMKPEDMRLAIAKVMGASETKLENGTTLVTLKEANATKDRYITPFPNKPDDIVFSVTVPNYPEDMNACVLLIDHLEKQGYACVLVAEDGIRRCTFVKGETEHSTFGPTFPEIISQSFLKTLNLYT